MEASYLKETPDTKTEGITRTLNNSLLVGKFGVPATYLYQPGPLSKKTNKILKRMIDFILASFAIAFFFPFILPLVAILIFIDSGSPVFFLQKRNKLNGGVFSCIKFRTMYNNQVTDNLPVNLGNTRITRFGKFLRQYHLDEMPQLINVWLGDMSLVGPRPYMICDNKRFEKLIPNYHIRHTVKPGITGLAQAAGLVGPMRDLAAVEERCERDIYYVNHWSLLLDFKIAYSTIRNIFGRKRSQ